MYGLAASNGMPGTRRDLRRNAWPGLMKSHSVGGVQKCMAWPHEIGTRPNRPRTPGARRERPRAPNGNTQLRGWIATLVLSSIYIYIYMSACTCNETWVRIISADLPGVARAKATRTNRTRTLGWDDTLASSSGQKHCLAYVTVFVSKHFFSH